MNDSRATVTAILGAIVGWLGTAASLLIQHVNAIAGLAAAGFAIYASWWAAKVARETMEVRKAERLRVALEVERVANELCRECLAGIPPEVCPKKPHAMPPSCPKRILSQTEPDRNQPLTGAA